MTRPSVVRSALCPKAAKRCSISRSQNFPVWLPTLRPAWFRWPPHPRPVTRSLRGRFIHLALPLRTKTLVRPFSLSTARCEVSLVHRTWATGARRGLASSAPIGEAPSVCVIGAGAAGLAAGRCLRDEGCRVTILEKSPYGVGGLWRSDPDVKTPMCESISRLACLSCSFIITEIAVERRAVAVSFSFSKSKSGPVACSLHM